MADVMITSVRDQGVSSLFQLFKNKFGPDPQESGATDGSARPDGLIQQTSLRLGTDVASMKEFPNPASFFASSGKLASSLPAVAVVPIAAGLETGRPFVDDFSLRSILTVLNRVAATCLLVPITKMDKGGFSQGDFLRAREAVEVQLRELGLSWDQDRIEFLPVAMNPADLQEFNVFSKCSQLAWHQGPTLIGSIRDSLNRAGRQPVVGHVKNLVQSEGSVNCIVDLDLPPDTPVYVPTSGAIGKVVGPTDGGGVRVRFDTELISPSTIVSNAPFPEPLTSFRAVLWTNELDELNADDTVLTCSLAGGQACQARLEAPMELAREENRVVFDCAVRLAQPCSLVDCKTSRELGRIAMTSPTRSTPIASGYISTRSTDPFFRSSEVHVDEQWVANRLQDGNTYPAEASSLAEEPAANARVIVRDYYSWFTEENTLFLEKTVNQELSFSDARKLEPLLGQMLRWERLAYIYPLFTEQKRARDHYVHVIRTAVLGDFILSLQLQNGQPFIDSVGEILGSGHAERPLAESIRRTWWIAALFHDCSYPLYAFLKPFQASSENVDSYKLAYGDKFIGLLSDDWTAIIDKLQGKVRRPLLKFVKDLSLPAFDQALRSAARSLDHGVLSAHILQDTLSGEDVRNIDLKAALTAVSLHNIMVEGLPIRFSEHPIAALLVLCDELQEWGRPIVSSQPGASPLATSTLVELESIAIRGLDTDGRNWRVTKANKLKFIFDYRGLSSDQASKSNFEPDKLYAGKRARLNRLILNDPALPEVTVFFLPPSYLIAREFEMTIKSGDSPTG